MSFLPCLASGILGWGIVLLVTPWLLKSCRRLNRSRPRDLHHNEGPAVSRLGGLSLAVAYIGIECFISLLFPTAGILTVKGWVVALAPLAMFGLGFWDDLEALGAKRKLMVQVLIALAVTKAGIAIDCPRIASFERFIDPGSWNALLTVGWLVSFTNLINLADGVDGLAGSLGIMLMVLMTGLSYAAGTLFCLTAGMTGALLAFLGYNFHPARIYLGDGGAYFLGFQLGLFSILLSQARTDVAAVLLPVFGLALPILDTLLALARRGLRGLPVFRPDRSHLHHHLLQAGLSPRRVVLWYCLLTLIFLCAGSAAVFWSYAFLVPLAVAATGLVLALCRLHLGRHVRWHNLHRKLSAWLALRRQIAYALCLRNWLKHEAARCSSVEELYADLKFAARRLGFTAVRLALADGDRLWKQPYVCGPLVSTCHSLQGGSLGVLELEAPRCRMNCIAPSDDSAIKHQSEFPCRPQLNDSRLIEILSELLAESWIEATRVWNLGRVHLRFDHKLPQSCGVQRRGAVGTIHSGRIAEAQARVLKPEEHGLAASSAGRFLRRTCGFVVGSLLLSAVDGFGGEPPSSAMIEETLAKVPRVELPARAASVVKAAEPADRTYVTGKVIRAVRKVSAAVITPVVGTISKTVPEMAAIAAGAAAVEQPGQAGAIARAAAAAAPAQTKAIIVMVCRAGPSNYRNIALSVEQAVPGSSKEILEGLAIAFPELRGAISLSFTPLGSRPSVTAVLDSAALVIVHPKPTLTRAGLSTLNRSPRTRGPSIGPPFVPWSGTLTNVTPSTSGTVPTGGRNYATP